MRRKPRLIIKDKVDPVRVQRRRNMRRTVFFVVISAIGIWVLYQVPHLGFGDFPTTSTVIETTKENGVETTKEVTTTSTETLKNLWDWLELSGAIAIPIVIYQFGRREQMQADERAKADKEKAERQAGLERELAAGNLREDALTAYIDRMAELLIDPNIMTASGRASKWHEDDPKQDVARIRTVTVLRRLEGDVERQGRVLYFLRDAGLLEFLLAGARLSGIDLSKADLRDANLVGADLANANLTSTDLSRANLNNANLSNAKLHVTKLIEAKLVDCDLFQATITYAQLMKADLSKSNLINTNMKGSDFREAILEGAELSLSDLIDVDLRAANLKRITFNATVLIPEAKGSITMKKGQSMPLVGGDKQVTGRSRLVDVDMRWAALDGADFSGATFEKVKVRGMTYADEHAPIFPDGFDPEGEEQTDETDAIAEE